MKQINATIRSTGYEVNVTVTGESVNESATFPFLSVPEPFITAWEAAEDWAIQHGATRIKILKEYRVKPAPREWWVNVYPGDLVSAPRRTKKEADKFAHPDRVRCVRLIDPLEWDRDFTPA